LPSAAFVNNYIEFVAGPISLVAEAKLRLLKKYCGICLRDSVQMLTTPGCGASSNPQEFELEQEQDQ
jgi:hypothetical protein